MTYIQNARMSTAKSWLAVLALGLAIFGVIRGIVWGLGGEVPGDSLPAWLLRMYGFAGQWPETWRQSALIGAVLVILLLVLIALIIGRKRSGHPGKSHTRVLLIGSWALYLPAILGSLPAVFGLVSAMVTPLIAAGLMPVVARLLPFDAVRWAYAGVVGGSGAYEHFPKFLTAQLLVAGGLALTIVGFIQVFRAHRENRLQTQGLYATLRHPQHLGIALWTFGLALAASSTAGYIMWFTANYLYVLLALREERLLALQFGSPYEGYRCATPFMIPFVKGGLPLPTSGGARRTAALIAYYVVGMAVLCLVMQAIGVEIAEFV